LFEFKRQFKYRFAYNLNKSIIHNGPEQPSSWAKACNRRKWFASPSIKSSEFIYYNLRMCVGDPRPSQTGHQGSDGILLESHNDGR